MKQKKFPAMPKRSRLSLLVGNWIILLLLTVIPADGQVTLAWNPSKSPNITGYLVRRGPSSGTYDKVIDVGNVATFSDQSAVPGETYYYAVSAISEAGDESQLSKELIVVATTNKRPTITEIADRTAQAGGLIRGINFRINDTETLPDGLVVTATSSNPDLIPPSLIEIIGNGSERSATVQTIGSEPGTATIQFTVSDGELTTKTQFEVALRAPQKRAPEGISQSVSVAEDSSVSVHLAGSGDDVTFRILSSPKMGSLSGNAPDLVYTPRPNETGTDYFTYIVSDGEFNSAPATISVDVRPVNDPPRGEIDRITVLPGREGRELTTGQESVLANDQDVDEDLISARLVDGPRNGILTFASDGTFVYKHGGSDELTDRFTYVAVDGDSTSEPIEVRISVFRVKSQYSSDNAVVLEWPGQLGNQYQVESTSGNEPDENEQVIITSISADEDKSLSVLVSPESFRESELSVRCINESGEVTAEVQLPPASE